MQWKKITLSAAMAIFSIPFVMGGFSESNAQSNQSFDFSQPSVRDRIQGSGYITSKPIPSWGVIVRSKEGTANLTEGEVVYIQLELGKEVQAGDRFSIVRLGNPVTHPVTKQKLGLLVLAPGELTILERKNEIAIAKINRSYAPISPGDMILPAKPVLPVTVPIRTQKRIEGIVVTSQEGAMAISEKEIAFIDRGSDAGVIVGDIFSIYQRPARLRGVYGEPKEEMKEIPLARVGELVVVSVQPETSTAVVTRSLQPIYIGDLAVSGTE
jgi:hypothetical protein